MNGDRRFGINVFYAPNMPCVSLGVHVDWHTPTVDLVPWWLYELRCHYRAQSVPVDEWFSYWSLHLHKAQMQFRWATWQETHADVIFEDTVNGGRS